MNTKLEQSKKKNENLIKKAIEEVKEDLKYLSENLENKMMDKLSMCEGNQYIIITRFSLMTSP